MSIDAEFSRLTSTDTRESAGGPASGSIAVVGMACRFPGGADGPDAYWQLLAEGRHAITEIPGDRWNVAEYFDPLEDKPGKMYSCYGGFLDRIDEFDAALFGISRREANGLDPQQRLLLESSWEALENAGLDPAGQSGSRVGVYVGISTSDYLQLSVRRNDPTLIDAYSGTGNAFSVAAGRLSYVYGFQGPSLALDTACSSSLVSLHLACRSLRAGECDMALAAGVSLILQPDTTISFSKARMLAPDGRCKTFDASADGYVRGEGCGVVVLKRLEDAQRQGDRVLAVIRGTAVNQDGRSNGLTAPNGQAQEAVIRAALADAGLDPADVDYIEAHGTGTPLGDPIEVRALDRVFGQSHTPDRPLLIGSVKTNLGHLEAAAGIAGFIKVVLSLQHRRIPAHLHFRRPSAHIEWDRIPVRVVTSCEDWPRAGGKGVAGISSFGFGGTNSHVIVEEAGETAPLRADLERPLHVLALSSRSAEGLSRLAKRYVAYLEEHPELDLADVAHTANAGRSQFGHRLALVSRNMSEAREGLGEFAGGHKTGGLWEGHSEPRRGVVYLFSGQGAQYAGMGQELYQTSAVFARSLDQCAQLLRKTRGWDLLAVLRGGDSSNLDETRYTQPAMFAIEWSLAELWRSWGLEPAAVFGHSVGEYAAACVAGVYSLEDGLDLVARRAELMSGMPGEGVMAAVMAGLGVVERLVESSLGAVSVAAVNGPAETVISGERPAMDRILSELRAAGIAAQPLTVSHAFHSRQMDGMLDAFEAAASQVNCRPPDVPWVANVDGHWMEQAPDAAYWRLQVRRPVKFLDAMRRFEEAGYGTFLEIGPQPVLVALGRRCLPANECAWLTSLRRGRGEWRQMAETLAQLYVRGESVDWSGFDRGYTRRRVQLPTYAFDRQRYWLERSEATPAPSAAVRKRDHPLLGSRVRTPLPEEIWENDLAAGPLAYLREHKVFGQAVLPGAAYIEMALAAAARRWAGSRCVVRRLEFREPLPLQEDALALHTVVRDGPEGAEFSVYHNRGTDTAAEWRILASGSLARIDGVAESAGQPPDAVRSQFDREGFYARLAANGLDYGASFQGVEHIWRGDGYRAGLIRLPAGLAESAADYQVHPVLLDACFHVLAAEIAGDEAGASVWLPVSVESVELVAVPPGAALRCYARLRDATAAAQGYTLADFEIFDESGHPMGRIAGLRLQQVSKSSWLGMTGSKIAGPAYAVEWHDAPLPAAAQPAPGRWLVFADRGGLAIDLAGQLRSPDTQVDLVGPGDIRNADASFADLIASVSGLQGVVYLWPLDGDAAETLEERHSMLTQGAFHLLQALAGKPLRQGFHVWFVTRGAQPVHGAPPAADLAAASLAAMARSAVWEHPELGCRCIDLDPAVPPDASSILAELAADTEEMIAIRGGKRLAPRLAPVDIGTQGASEDPPARLEIETRGTLDNLQLRPIARQTPGEGEVEIEVHASGLNFRDVLNALGLYPGDPGPLGCECAGRITAVGPGAEGCAVGQEVMAIAPACFASYVVAHRTCVWPKPADLSFAEAATLPITFLTAQYGLQHLAGMKAGDRVLLHAAAGGVGQAAVQLARRAGAEVFATASPAKWESVRANGAQHIMNSRSIDYAAEIMQITGGRGVDIVLNSLFGDHIPKSLGVLAPGGRFLEIGKREIWTAEQMAAARPDVTYCVYDLAEQLRAEPQLLHTMFQDLLPLWDGSGLQALTHTDFPIQRAPAAFRFMAQARHVGKVVVTQRTDAQNVVRGDRVYLITGGLGSLGLQVARWLIAQGARRLLLVGRSAPGDEQRRQLDALAAQAEIRTAQVDIASFDQASALFRDTLASMGPLGGIVHAAGVLDDGLLTRLTWDRFERVLSPKARGAWNLHRLTGDMPLDFFVLFSSMASAFGSPSQINYAAANGFLDALAHHRKALGLAAVSVNWGPWAEGGMAAGIGEGRRDLWAGRGLEPFRTEAALALLGDVLRADQAQVVAVQIDWPKFLAQMPADTMPGLFSKLGRPAASAQNAEHSREARAGLLDSLHKAPPRRRHALIVARILEDVRIVLGLTSSDSIDPRQGLNSLGMDSLMAVELRSRLQDAFGISLPATMAFEHPNIDALAEFLAGELDLKPAVDAPSAVQAAAAEHSADLDLEECSEEDLEGLLEQKLTAMQSASGTGVSTA